MNAMPPLATPFPNQPSAYEDVDLYADDLALQEGVAREGAAAFAPRIAAWGATLGQRAVLQLADACNRNPPQWQPLDARGERVDEVAFHPAWHSLMALAAAAGEHCAPWTDPAPGAQVARGALYLLHGQVENGTQCPLTMTYASVPVLRGATPPLRDLWLPRVLAPDYDPRPLPVAEKRAALIGMGMTERQGGSDVRSNLTRAEAAGDGSARLHGHKWFFSAPQCDAHLTLAQGAEGLTCYLLPRMLPDGTRNAVRINRLKDKLGNRSNASAEVEFDDAVAWPVGDPGRGIATILQMVQHTRLDCVLGTAGMMRAAVARAFHHARQRVVFGQRLADTALMRNVLADLALESEAATALALRLARTFEADASPAECALARVLTPAAKFWICKRGPMLAAEAMEVLGGNGYVEESALPRLYREMPVNSIWEGSGNVMCLDVVRALRREPAAVAAVLDELGLARGAHSAFDARVRDLEAGLANLSDDGHAGRRLAQAITTLVQASLLLRHAPRATAEAFCATRLEAAAYAGAVFGALPAGLDVAPVLARAVASSAT